MPPPAPPVNLNNTARLVEVQPMNTVDSALKNDAVWRDAMAGRIVHAMAQQWQRLHATDQDLISWASTHSSL